MKIEMARHSGFCMGVRNAILKIVDKLNSTDDDIYVYGPLIHNPQTIQVLGDRGLKIAENLDTIDGKDIAIRTHGVPVHENKIIRNKSRKAYNLTCSRVARVQAIIRKYSLNNYYTLIIGDKEHAEVIGLMSYAQAGVSVISSREDIKDIPKGEKYLVVSQTTHEREQFYNLVEEIISKFDNTKVIDTICDSTRLRQNDVNEAIERGIDTLVVVGGRNSANTTRLAKLGRDNNIKTLHIETDSELSLDDFLSSKYVFVTAGASTPGWIINNVLEKIYMFKKSRGNLFIKVMKTFFEFLVRSNILSSITAGFMVALTQLFLGIQLSILPMIIASIYIYYMYSINNYIDREFLSKSNSYKYKIYQEHGFSLLIGAIILVPISLFLAWGFDKRAFILLTIVYSLGTIYSTNYVKKIVRHSSLKNIDKLYNSRIITPFGWILAVLIIPLLDIKTISVSKIILSAILMLFIYTMTAMRQIISDTIAFHGDFILGRGTIPTWLGIKWTTRFSYIFLGATAILLGSSTFLTGELIYNIYILNLMYFFVILKKVMSKNYLISLKYELLTDLNYVLFILFTIITFVFFL